ncbi:MAG TPA: ABC transporter permease [Thermoleophilaceae bacterium]|nr:ABC transporter permease [Thermoleophilaceae bacterium]
MSAVEAASARDATAAFPDRGWRGGLSGLGWLVRRECLRVFKLWTQTVLAPIVSSILFILVFGLSLGARIRDFAGLDYEVFIVPGLITMAMVQAAYNNTSASVFQGRQDRYINDVLSAPMHAWQVNLGYAVGGVVRSLAIGVGLVALAVPLTGIGVERPLFLLAAVLIGLIAFSALGTIVGIFAETFDKHTFVSNIVILPLVFLGGVFYSVASLPAPWEQISHANPLFYLVNAIRYGFIGHSDVDPVLALVVAGAIAAPLYAWAQWLFSTGRKLKA